MTVGRSERRLGFDRALDTNMQMMWLWCWPCHVKSENDGLRVEGGGWRVDGVWGVCWNELR